MTLTGYRRTCTKRSGGVRSIALIPASGVSSAVYAQSTDSYTAITLASGVSFASYSFREDQAWLRETTSLNAGSLSVTHELSFTLDGMDSASRKAVEQIAEASCEGLIAAVTTNNNEKLLVGYSPSFAAERALKLTTDVGNTGQLLGDSTSEVINLRSIDTEKAKTFTGTTGWPIK